MRTETRIEALTGIRFVAALWVALLHFRIFDNSRGWAFPVLDPLIANGQSGVDLFFVLSGFVLAHAYGGRVQGPHRVSYRQFIGYRLARIYPLHSVTFAWMAVLLLCGFGATWLDRDKILAPANIVATLTLTNDWLPGLAKVGTANPPSWSLSAEFFCYLLMPLALPWTRRGPSKALATIMGGAALLLGCEWGWVPPIGDWRAVGGFMVGMGTYCLRGRLPATPRAAGLVAGGAIVLWAVSRDHPAVVIGDFLFAALFLAVSSPADLLGRRLSTPRMVYLGEISFSLYLCQIPVKEIIKRLLQESGLMYQILPPMIILLYLATSLIVAALLHRFIEIPGQSIIRRFIERNNVRERRLALTA